MVCKLAMDIDIHKIQQDIKSRNSDVVKEINSVLEYIDEIYSCLLYTSPSPRDATLSRMPSSA